MREIKFRAWKTTEKLMSVPFSPVAGHGYTMDFVDKSQEPHDIAWPDDVVYMQYTGRKDKNGVEIYEGDIISAMQPLWDYDPNAPVQERRYVVEWDNENSRFINAWPTAEVIGNIYENPELMEAKS